MAIIAAQALSIAAPLAIMRLKAAAISGLSSIHCALPMRRAALATIRLDLAPSALLNAALPAGVRRAMSSSCARAASIGSFFIRQLQKQPLHAPSMSVAANAPADSERKAYRAPPVHSYP